MDTEDKSQFAQERRLSTTEERKVLALEMIADHLQSISRAFVPIDDVRGGQATFERMTATEGGKGVADRWGNESESAEPGSPEALGVERTPVEHFPVGGHNYTNIAHAIAQAKRDRRNGEHR